MPCVCLIAAWVLATTGASAADATPVAPSTPVIRSMADFYAVPDAMRSVPHPVDMEIHIIYADPEWGMVYFLSGDGPPAFSDLTRPKLRLQTRDVVRLTGTLKPADRFDLSRLTVSRVVSDRPLAANVVEDNLPALLRLEIALVRVEGFVDSQNLHDPTHLYLNLIVGGQRILGVLLLEPDAPIPDLVGHLIEAEGILIPDRALNPTHLARLDIGGMAAIETQGLAADNPRFSALPITPISQLAQFATQADVGTSRRRPWIHVAGRIETIDAGRETMLVDATGRIRLLTAQTLDAARGNEVEACGIPVLTTRGWRLERPIIRAVRRADSPATQAPYTPESPAPAAPSIEPPPIDASLPPDQLPVLTSTQDFWTVPTERKDWLHRVDMEIHVAYCDPGWNVTWAQSGNRIDFFKIKRGDVDFSTGQVVRISGLIRPVADAVTLDPSLEIKTIEPYRPFEIIPVDGNISDTALAHRMVRVTGLVDLQEDNGPFHVALTMIVDGHRITARYRTQETDRLANYTGQIVTLEGLLTPPDHASDADFTAELWVGRTATIVARTSLALDPRFNLAPSSIEQLSKLPTDQPVRVVGTIREVEPGKSVTIEDDTELVTIRTAQKIPGAINSRIEAWGYPTEDSTRMSLSRALLRKMTMPATAAGASRGKVRVIHRSVGDVLDLSADDAARGAEVRLTGVVTWSSVQTDHFFIRDGSAGIRVIRIPGPPATRPPPPSPGTVVVVSGRTASDGISRFIEASTVETQSSRPLNDPTLTSVEQAWSGSEDAQRIKLAGYVRSVHHEAIADNQGWTHLDLVGAGGQTFRATLPHDPAADQYEGLVIRLTGVCTAVTTGQTHQVSGIRLWLSFPTDIEEVDKDPEDPFARRLQSIQSLRSFGGSRKGIGLARVTGQVLAHLPNNGIVVWDNSGGNQPGMYAFLRDAAAPSVGDSVDLVGLVGHDQNRIALREARCRVIERNVSESPSTLNNFQGNPRYDCQLVRVRASLVDKIVDDAHIAFRMVGNGLPFQASLDTTRISKPLDSDLAPGALVELTGVYRIDARDPEHPERFSLLLRSSDDVDVIDAPSWFTAERARTLAGGLCAVLAVAFVWAYSLRRRVRHQTGQIRKQLIREARLEDRQRNIIEKASDFIFMLDLSGNFTLFNPAGEAMTGYARDDVPRLSIYDLIDESDRIGLHTSLLKARPESEIQPFQTQFRRKDGTLIWVEVAMRFLVEEEQVTGALCVARDITERKAVEDELKRARDAAEANTKAKSAFLANMSHEIRTPMNGVIGMSNLLLDTPLSHDQRDFALTIRNSAEALLTVLNDILDFSKIEAGKLQFETLDFDLTETVDDTLDLLAARAASKHLELAALIPTTLPQKLRGDPGRLRQVLLNLVGNAIKFTEKGDVSVNVSLEHETREGCRLRFEVHDTGIGIGPAEREQLFMPFSQADASTTRKYGGTGLGLAICRQIVEQMNGQIGVRSEPGKGSTFWFIVELARGSAAPLEPQPGMLRGARVLGVDDNQINRTVLQHYLEPYGVRLDLASDAQEALGMLRAAATSGDPFRLVLLDYHMPEMDGIALARAIHTDARFRALRMALLTSVDRRFTLAELQAVGITASMAKPIRQRELMHTIQRAFSSESAPATVSAMPEALTTAALPALRVLIAEDNLVNQRLTRIQLKKLGYEADLACNGLEVLEAFERVPYDVIFMDCQMPELDGYDTARRLASHPRRGDVRIVAMTANAMQGDRDKCLESGMDDYLSKPTRPDELTAALRRAAEAITRTAGA